MKSGRVLIVILMIALGLIVLGLTSIFNNITQTSPNHAVIEVVREFDFGQRELRTTVESTIQIRNVGLKPLHIGNITTDCGCVGVFSAQNEGSSEKSKTLEIHPYGDGHLLIKLGVSGSPGVAERRRITFLTNDPTNPQVDIILRVTSIGRYASDPARLTLGSIPIGT